MTASSENREDDLCPQCCRKRNGCFLTYTPRTGQSAIGPKAASNASEAANPTVSDALPRKHLVSPFSTLHCNWKREHTLPREFGTYLPNIIATLRFGRKSPVYELSGFAPNRWQLIL